MKSNDIILSQKNFLLLWSGSFVSQFGDKMYSIAMAWWILNISGSPGIMGLYMASVSLPGIIAGLFSGVIVDRANKRNLIVIMDVLRGFLVGFLALLFITGQVKIWHVFVAGITVSIASSFFNPAVLSILPRIVKKRALHKANSFMQMIGGISTIAGPLMGALAVSVISYQGAILINALSYLISGFFELFISKSSESDNSSKEKQHNKQWILHFIRDFKEGYKFIQERSILLRILVFIALGHFFIGAFLVSMPLIADTFSKSNVFFLGFMQVAFGGGYVLGASFTSRRKKLGDTMKNLKFFFLVIAFVTLSIAAILTVQYIPLLSILLLLPIIGFCIVCASVYWRTAIQINTPDNLLGRISSVSSLIGDVSLPIAFAVFGYFFSIWSIPVVLSVCGSILMLATFLTDGISLRKVQKEV